MAIARTAFPSWERVARQRVYWATNYKRTWKGSAVTSFVSPLFYVVAMGVLLGGFVDDSTAGTNALGGAPSYLAFVAPGLAAAHAMQIATGEVTWPVMGNLKWHRTYYAMVATPLSVPDVVAAHLAYVAFRLAITTGVFLLVLAPFGVFESVTGVLLEADPGYVTGIRDRLQRMDGVALVQTKAELQAQIDQLMAYSQASIWLMFFNWSLIVSMRARLRSSNLSQSRMSRFFMFLRILVKSSSPWTKRASCNAWEIYPRSPKSWPKSRWLSVGTGWRSSTWPGVRQKAKSSPASLTIRCSLKP